MMSRLKDVLNTLESCQQLFPRQQQQHRAKLIKSIAQPMRNASMDACDVITEKIAVMVKMKLIVVNYCSNLYYFCLSNRGYLQLVFYQYSVIAV